MTSFIIHVIKLSYLSILYSYIVTLYYVGWLATSVRLKEFLLAQLHHFPVWLSRFIGRENEITAVRQLLLNTRLLTLTGTGGCGKTRLAQEAARQAQAEFPDGVWLVELAAVTNSDHIVQSTVAAFDLAERSDLPTMVQLNNHLSPLRALLVLDNCEHLIEGCARFVFELLSQCSQLHIIATSREPLHIAGERVYPVPSLTLHHWQPGLPVEHLFHSEAVQLFLDRAQSIQPDLTVRTPEAQAIYSICQMLDGVPLALELAAARVGVLSLQEMAGWVNNAFRWLESGDRLAPPRHQTMRAALDWSYNLLQSEEQLLYRRLSVFLGGFSLQAAEQVCSGDGIEPDQVFSLLYRLIDKSFLTHTNADLPVSRYSMLEVVRQHSLEKLALSGEENNLRNRHFTWCLSFARRAELNVVGDQRSVWIKQVENELPNLRLAMKWSMSGYLAPEMTHQLAATLEQFWQMRGYIREGLQWYESALSSSIGVSYDILANTLSHAAYLALHLWDVDIAHQYAEKALQIRREQDDREGIAQILSILGLIYIFKKDFHKARQVTAESLAFFDTTGPRYGAAVALWTNGEIAYMEEDFQQAEEFYRKSLTVANQIGYKLGSNRRVIRLAQVAVAQGKAEHALSLLYDGIQDCRNTGDRWIVAMASVAAASLLFSQGYITQAARYILIAKRFVETFGTHLWLVDRKIYEDLLRILQTRLSHEKILKVQGEVQNQSSDLEEVLDFILEGLKIVQGNAPSRIEDKNFIRRLTSREYEVAALIAQGRNNTEIAKTLFVGVRTVETHITHILTKLNFTSRTQIAVWAAKQDAE